MTLSKTQAAPLRRRLWNISKIILALGLFAWIFSKTEVDELSEVLSTASPGWLALSLLTFAAMTALKALQYKVILGSEAPLSSLVQVAVLQNAISNFIASTAGMASYFVALRSEHHVRVERAMTAFVIVQTGNLFAVWAMLLGSVIFSWTFIKDLQVLVVLLLAGMAGGLLTFLFAIILRQRFLTFVQRVSALLRIDRLALVVRALDAMKTIVASGQGVLFQKLGRALIFSTLYMILTLIWGWTLLLSLDFTVPWYAFVFVLSLLQILSLAPVQIFGGLGVSEVSMLYLYGLFGFGMGQVTPILLAIRIINYAMSVLSLLYLPVYTFLFKKKKFDAPPQKMK